MHFFINELSFIGQAKDSYEADELMDELIGVIKEIDKIKGNDIIKNHPIISSCQLAPDLTLYEWLQRKLNSGNSRDKRVALELTQIIRKGNTNIRNLLQNCQCFSSTKDISDSSIAGAVHLQGILISLQNAEEFSEENIIIILISENQENQNRTIHNLTRVPQARKICPRYNPDYGKHDSMRTWKNATTMDLRDEDAQKALNRSIEYKDRQRFSYFREKFYRFHFENTYNAQGYPTYHGYPVKDSDVPNDIKKQLIE